MFQGELLGIFVAPTKAAALEQREEARAVPGQGLQGDRYGEHAGTFSKSKGRRPDQEVTLIEVEALEGMQRDYQIELAPAQSRRNLLTRNVPLNHLVGREFFVGDVRLRGLRLCEPCGHLEKLTSQGVEAALAHRGGLRAQVVSEGTLRAGDAIRLCEE